MTFFLNGMEIDKTYTGFGLRYIFFESDNVITYDIVEFSVKEFFATCDDQEYLRILKPYKIEDISGMDWDIKIGNNKPNLFKIFKTIELLGKVYTSTNFPNVLYYEYENKKMHNHYSQWMMDMDYKKIHDKNGLTFFYREK